MSRWLIGIKKFINTVGIWAICWRLKFWILFNQMIRNWSNRQLKILRKWCKQLRVDATARMQKSYNYASNLWYALLKILMETMRQHSFLINGSKVKITAYTIYYAFKRHPEMAEDFVNCIGSFTTDPQQITFLYLQTLQEYYPEIVDYLNCISNLFPYL